MTFKDLRALREQRNKSDDTASDKQQAIGEHQNDVSSLKETEHPSERPKKRQPVSTTVVGVRTLAARVNLSYAREFEHYLLAAEEFFPRVTKEEGLPALIRLLRQEDFFERWLDEVDQVRQERREQRG